MKDSLVMLINILSSYLSSGTKQLFQRHNECEQDGMS